MTSTRPDGARPPDGPRRMPAPSHHRPLPGPDGPARSTDARRWASLAFIALAQLMITLDATVVNIALPSAQAALHITDADRQWVVTAYTLAFGCLLLFGGRLGDALGHRRALLVGLVGFAGASVLGGAATSGAALVTARAVQGACGALLAPAALALVSLTFPARGERARAFAVYSAVSGSGGALGLLLGGALTQYLDWRWSLYVNVPLTVVAAVGVLVVVAAPPTRLEPRPLDLPGVVLSGAGLVLLVLALADAERGPGAGTVLKAVAALALLVAFVVVESRSPAPLLPLRVLADRTRAGAYLVLTLSVVGLYGVFLFLTYVLQGVQSMDPLRTGLAFLPMVAGLVLGSAAAGTPVAARLGARAQLVLGALVAAAGLLVLTRLQVHSGYFTLIVPAEVLVGLGTGAVFVPAISLGTDGVAADDVGTASATTTAVQQIGGAVGTALLNGVAAGATAAALVGVDPLAPAASGATFGETAAVHGFAVASWWAAGALCAAAAAALLVRPGPGKAQGEP